MAGSGLGGRPYGVDAELRGQLGQILKIALGHHGLLGNGFPPPTPPSPLNPAPGVIGCALRRRPGAPGAGGSGTAEVMGYGGGGRRE
ncbi:hypothetical protein GCM10020216_048400 [Nonomuraea helvata]